ncbi:hypothetical protein [Shinella sp.]|uniref:hypothetical protein n=1 Tax=Shinella sp. TaxID=1870904 RepID=UPI00301CDFC6
MTALLASLIAFSGVLGIYLATRFARAGLPHAVFFDGGRSIPSWALMFALGGLMLTGTGFSEQLDLAGRYGLQASHAAIGLVVAALVGILLGKRLWLAARIAGFSSPGDALGTYYGSVTMRLVMLGMAMLFGLPFAADLLSDAGRIVAGMSDGGISRAVAVWALAFFLFLPAVIGGWRPVAFLIAIESAVFAVILLAVTLFGETVSGGPGFLAKGIATAPGILHDALPGVVQYAAGIGKDVVPGGFFTALGVFSRSLSFAGVVTSPVVLYLMMTARAGKGLSFGMTWLSAGLAAGILVLALPFLAARTLSDSVAYAHQLAALDAAFAAGFVFALVLSAQIAVLAFTGGGALLFTRELVLPYMLPGMTEAGNRFAGRIAIAIAFLAVAFLAAFAPLLSAILASLALPLSIQLFPALLGLAFVRWISRSAVIIGLILGGLFVFFTEPPGLVLFEGLFLDLPWGRWPLTIHSALWGLALNLSAVLLVSIFTRKGEERTRRDRLHDEFAARWPTDFGGKAGRGAKWSLTLIWAFLAIGPGAILGNTFFSQPIFTDGDAALGLPSLWVWQILFWLLGAFLVWWLAEPAGLGRTSEDGLRAIRPEHPAGGQGRNEVPAWIASSIARVVER